MSTPVEQAAVGAVVETIHGNKLRRFEDGWSPLKGAHWDRWTVYSDAELVANFALVGPCRTTAGEDL